MMKRTVPHWVAIAVLSFVLIAVAVKFIVLGSTGKADDGRTAVLLESVERQQVLEEMRMLLESSQAIVEALADERMDDVAVAARKVGRAAVATVDMRLRAKLPLEFKKLGFATHDAFDDIADMAGRGDSAKAVQQKLAVTMNNCIACHAAYQLPQNRSGR